MTLRAVVDNDILIKGACYGLPDQMAAAIPVPCEQVGFLGAAPFVIRSKIRKRKLNKKLSIVIRFSEGAFRRMIYLEPTESEIAFAAELERIAQVNSFALDFGESQLCAITVLRELDWLITGDKRAARALQDLLFAGANLEFTKKRIICLEQVIFAMIAFKNMAAESLICSESDVDRALTICFSCHSLDRDINSWLAGLRSYIEHLRSVAPAVLSAN